MQSHAVALTGSPRPARARTVLQDDGGAGHVALHVAHAQGRLDGDAARVKGDALAHEGDLGRGLRRGVLDLYEARLPGGALADAEDAAEALLLEALLVPDGHLDRQALGQFLGGFGEGLGVEVARRLVHQRAGRVHGRANQGRPVQDRLEPLVRGEVGADDDVLYRILEPVLGGPELGVGIGAHRGALGDGRDLGQGRRRKCHGDGGDAGQLADGRAGGAAQRLLGERLLPVQFADAGEEQDGGPSLGQAGQPVSLVRRAGDAKNAQ